MIFYEFCQAADQYLSQNDANVDDPGAGRSNAPIAERDPDASDVK